MKATILKIDYFIQSLFIILTICCIPTFILAGVGYFMIGAWQILSALVLGIVLRSEIRQIYFLAAGAYLGALYLGCELIDKIDLPDLLVNTFGVLGFLVIPTTAAAVYFIFTKKEYHTMNTETNSKFG